MNFGISGHDDARSGVEGFCPEVKKSKALDVTSRGTKVDRVELPQDYLTGFRIWYLRSGSLLCTMYFPTLAVVSTRKSTVIVESLAYAVDRELSSFKVTRIQSIWFIEMPRKLSQPGSATHVMLLFVYVRCQKLPMPF